MARLVAGLLAAGLIATFLPSGQPGVRAADSDYFLPAPGGTALYVTGGNGGYHQGWEYYAWDFAVGRTEFPVAAAHSGRVIGIRADSTANCTDSSCWREANYVLVNHCDGKTAGLYMHLAVNTLKVGVGDRIQMGTVLANADSTGWSTGNHLHFQVEQLPAGVDGTCGQTPGTTVTSLAGWWFRPSVAITFGDFDLSAKTAGGPIGVPVAGETYVSSNPTPVVTAAPTPSPTPASYGRLAALQSCAKVISWFSKTSHSVWYIPLLTITYSGIPSPSGAVGIFADAGSGYPAAAPRNGWNVVVFGGSVDLGPSTWQGPTTTLPSDPHTAYEVVGGPPSGSEAGRKYWVAWGIPIFGDRAAVIPNDPTAISLVLHKCP